MEATEGTIGVNITDVEADFSGGCTDPQTFFFQCSHCSRPVKIKLGCGKRFEYFCRPCAKRWRGRTFKRYYRTVVTFKNPRFLTLTLRKSVDGNKMQNRLMSLWKMKKYLFKRLARAGYKIVHWVATIEPPNHIHLIIDSNYIPQYEISEVWEEVTGDSYIVDIRRISRNDLTQIAAYIVKYLARRVNGPASISTCCMGSIWWARGGSSLVPSLALYASVGIVPWSAWTVMIIAQRSGALENPPSRNGTSFCENRSKNDNIPAPFLLP